MPVLQYDAGAPYTQGPSTYNNQGNSGYQQQMPLNQGSVYNDPGSSYNAAFKLISTGEANESQGEMFNNWMLDFARQNRLNPSTANQVSQIISQNYNVTPSGPLYDSSTSVPQFNYNGNQMPNSGYQTNSASYGNTYNSPTGCQCQQNIGCVPCSQNPTSAYGNQNPIYYDQNGFSPLNGAVYKGQDTIFLFMSETVWSSGAGAMPTSDDRRVADQMGEKWTQFAKEG
ncbi:hypothetical protein COOONC_23173 [Cooperia oncophora]